MIQRCTNPNHENWHRYGGRGITVCERWRSFNLFLEDMGERPSRNHTIDRKDTSGNYEPGKCRWATKTEQSRGRCCVKLTMESAEQIRLMKALGNRVADIAALFNISPSYTHDVINEKTWKR